VHEEEEEQEEMVRVRSGHSEQINNNKTNPRTAG